MRVSQTYYVNVDNRQGQFDFNYYSGFFSQGSHYSPIQTRLTVRPTLYSSVSFNAEYNPTFHQIPSLSLSAQVNRPRATLQGGWSRVVQVAEKVEQRTTLFNTLRGSGRFTLWPERLTVEGSLTYDLFQKIMLQSTTRIRYGIQCCGFSVERLKYNTRYRTETKTTFQIDLGGIGSIGNFLGDNSAGQNNAGRK